MLAVHPQPLLSGRLSEPQSPSLLLSRWPVGWNMNSSFSRQKTKQQNSDVFQCVLTTPPEDQVSFPTVGCRQRAPRFKHTYRSSETLVIWAWFCSLDIHSLIQADRCSPGDWWYDLFEGGSVSFMQNKSSPLQWICPDCLPKNTHSLLHPPPFCSSHYKIKKKGLFPKFSVGK